MKSDNQRRSTAPTVRDDAGDQTLRPARVNRRDFMINSMLLGMAAPSAWSALSSPAGAAAEPGWNPYPWKWGKGAIADNPDAACDPCRAFCLPPGHCRAPPWSGGTSATVACWLRWSARI